MMKQFAALAATAALALSGPALAQTPNDAQIAHIAYTAGQIDVAAGRQALQRSRNPQVRAFARTMVKPMLPSITPTKAMPTARR